MRKLFIVAIIIVILIMPIGVTAQGQTPIEFLQIEFWPEYDRTDMLVFYNIDLSEDTIFPVELSIRIPARAGAPNAVAEALDNRLVNAEYTMEEDGDWTKISITANSTYIHVEYYDPGLDKNGIDRNFEFNWLGDHPVKVLQYKVQQPPDATNMKLSLPMSAPVAQDGLNYYFAELSDLGIGENQSLSISYNKESNALTVESKVQQDETQAESSTPLSQQINYRWVLAAIAVGLIAYGVYNSLQVNKPKKRSSRKSASKRSRRTVKGPKVENIFCHSCGAGGGKNDKFCRECGEKLRV